MIKILYILEATTGGTQKHVFDIAKKISKSEYQIDIVASTFRNTHFIEDSRGIFYNTYALPITRNASISDLSNIWRIRNIIKLNKYDIVHCHSTKAGFVGRIAAFLSGHKNIVYSPHGFMFCDTRIRMKRLLYLRLEKLLGYLTRKIVAVSSSERELAINNRIVPQNKIITINNSIDALDDNGVSYANRISKKFNDKNSEIILGSVTRLQYAKDPFTLIKSFKIINERIPNTKLIMVGDGPLESECINLIDELNLKTKIQLAGFQKNSKSFYKFFDIFILSSHYEGMPYALLEAMSMGIPAVGTNVSGIKDLIVEGETGYLVGEGNYQELADAVIKLVLNPEKLSVFSSNAKKLADNNYNLDNGIKNYQEFYSSLSLGTT
jgi:glycosyltransferase involved in cell wall biosynthesis